MKKKKYVAPKIECFTAGPIMPIAHSDEWAGAKPQPEYPDEEESDGYDNGGDGGDDSPWQFEWE